MNSYIQNNTYRGFLVLEAIIALALFSICVFSTITLTWSARSLFESAKDREALLDLAAPIIAQSADFGTELAHAAYGNDATIATFSSSTDNASSSGIATASVSFSFLRSDTFSGYGKDTCPPILGFSGHASSTTIAALPISSKNEITDLSVKGGFAYISTDSGNASDPDLYIFDVRDMYDLKLVSSLNAGPGLAALVVAGPYVFAANKSSVNELEVIDIHDRSHPAVVADAKVPLDIATSAAPYASAIFYDKGFIYLGTEKGDSPELTIWNVADPLHPMLSGRYETGSKVEKILVENEQMYVAGTGDDQLTVFDVTNPTAPALASILAPPGYQTQNGKALDLFEQGLAFGRDTGGYNNAANPEFISYAVSGSLGQNELVQEGAFDEPGGIYGLVARPPYFLALTHRSTGQLRLDSASGTTSSPYTVPGDPVALSCDWGDIYVASNNRPAITLIKDFHE